MLLPPVPIINNSECFVSGNVTIHETAVLAFNIILQAAPHSQIIIGEGVCLGKGTILNAYAGTIEIESGVMLGAGVLIIGRCTIGKNSCIGAATTILNTNVESLAMIPSGSLLGDTSRTCQPNKEKIAETKAEIPSPWDEELIENNPVSEQIEIQKAEDSAKIKPEIIEVVSPSFPQQSNSLTKNSVIGKVYINQLLISLFPEREHFKKNTSN